MFDGERNNFSLLIEIDIEIVCDLFCLDWLFGTSSRYIVSVSEKYVTFTAF